MSSWSGTVTTLYFTFYNNEKWRVNLTFVYCERRFAGKLYGYLCFTFKIPPAMCVSHTIISFTLSVREHPASASGRNNKTNPQNPNAMLTFSYLFTGVLGLSRRDSRYK